MEQKTKKKMRGGIKVLLISMVILAVIVGAFLTFVLGGKEHTRNLTLEGLTASSVADGVYKGSYSGMRWSTAVEVTVKGRRIADINVVKEQAIIKPETAKALKDTVISAQSTDVDTVSGATATTKAYLKAVENALKSAPSA